MGARSARSREVAAKLKAQEQLVNAVAMRLQKELRMKAREAVKLASEIAANNELVDVNVAVSACMPRARCSGGNGRGRGPQRVDLRQLLAAHNKRTDNVLARAKAVTALNSVRGSATRPCTPPSAPW